MVKSVAVLLLAIAAQTLGDSVSRGTKLVSTFLIHRHGDRTPVESSLFFSTNSDELIAASAKYGYGQLTDLGKQRSYEMGKYIRSRYGSLLSPQYNRSEIYIRSTDSTRAMMTVLTAMSAVYPAYPDSWSKEINWVPTPYNTVPAKYDINMAMLNCPVFISSWSSLMMADNSRMSIFMDELNVISEQLGYNITTTPVLLYAAFDVFVSQQNLGVKLGATITANFDAISAAADEAIDIVFGDIDNIKLQAGPLLNDFFIYTAKQMADVDTPSVRIYSAHDFNVYSLMAVSQITPRQGVPKYNSAFALELRQIIETGDYVVLPVYKPTPDEHLVYLSVSGCDSLLCPYDTFKEIVSPYLLDEETWRTNCGFTDDLIIDDSIIT